MELVTFARDAPLAEMLAVFERDGGMIIRDLFPAASIDAMHSAITQQAQRTAPGSKSEREFWRDFHGANTIRFTSLGLLSPAYFEMLENPLFGAIADAVLLPQCGSYWVNTGQAMLIGPAEPAQMLHRDCGNWGEVFKPLWPNAPEITLSTMIALEDLDEELGATRVIPGSHLWQDIDRPAQPEESVAATMSAGSGLVYSGKVFHGGGANHTSDRWRMAMHLSFVVGWLTPEEANAMEYPAELVATLSPRVQALLGFASYDPGTHRSGRLWTRDFDAWKISIPQ